MYFKPVIYLVIASMMIAASLRGPRRARTASCV